MSKRKPHAPEFKAKVALETLNCGAPGFLDALPPDFEARRPTWGRATAAMSSSGTRCTRSRCGAIRFERFRGVWGVSSHSLHKWMKQFADPAPKAGSVDHEAENRQLKRELIRVTEERDILKKAAPYFARESR